MNLDIFVAGNNLIVKHLTYLDAQIVPDDIEIKFDKTIKVPLDKNGNEVV